MFRTLLARIRKRPLVQVDTGHPAESLPARRIPNHTLFLFATIICRLPIPFAF
ncbi:hypothetical protein [Fibrella aestuarina]|uniref:hypothetical protein n=1 Tax=Fibrella aestuarina TaxID=651143 RepID=UPI00130E7069|nr:hypothetical protein [Fibrella aestuarina]